MFKFRKLKKDQEVVDPAVLAGNRSYETEDTGSCDTEDYIRYIRTHVTRSWRPKR